MMESTAQDIAWENQRQIDADWWGRGALRLRRDRVFFLHVYMYVMFNK